MKGCLNSNSNIRIYSIWMNSVCCLGVLMSVNYWPMFDKMKRENDENKVIFEIQHSLFDSWQHNHHSSGRNITGSKQTITKNGIIIHFQMDLKICDTWMHSFEQTYVIDALDQVLTKGIEWSGVQCPQYQNMKQTKTERSRVLNISHWILRAFGSFVILENHSNEYGPTLWISIFNDKSQNAHTSLITMIVLCLIHEIFLFRTVSWHSIQKRMIFNFRYSSSIREKKRKLFIQMDQNENWIYSIRCI